jgi:hypothetical protein
MSTLFLRFFIREPLGFAGAGVWKLSAELAALGDVDPGAKWNRSVRLMADGNDSPALGEQ